MTTDLDTRLNLAAGALRRSVAELPLGEPRRPSRSPVALGLVVLLVAGVLAVTIAVRSGDDTVGLEVTPATEVQALIADPVPEGLQVTWVGEQTAQAAAGADAGVDGDGATVGVGGATTAGPVDLQTYLYGDANAENPFAETDMVVNVWDSSTIGAGVDAYGDADIAAAGGTAATVRGHEGMTAGVDGVASVRWYEAQDLEVVLASRSLTIAQLLAIAEGLGIDGTAVALGALPAALPGALDQVAALGGTTVAGVRATVASWVGYTGVGGDLDQVLDITTLAGGTDDLMALLWELGATEQVTVRGQQAFVATGAGVAAGTGAVANADEAVKLVWQEASGVLVHVTAYGLSQADVLRIVNGLQVSTADEWATVTELATTAQAAASGAAEAATGAVGDVEAGVEAGAGAGADVPASAVEDAAGAVVDVVTDIEATLHEDLGTAAVVGTVGSALGDVEAGLEGITGSVEAGAEAGAGALLDP